jgi:uncharacterized spore protein YtfJ
MERSESMLKTAMAEIERVLSTKTIVGDPVTIEGNTIVPLISLSFAFGAGYGSGSGGKRGGGGGAGGGSGGAGRAKAVAVIVATKDGVNLTPIVGGAAGAMEKVAETAVNVAGKVLEKRM